MPKNKRYLFHKPSAKEDIPLRIPELVISIKLIKRKKKKKLKFLGVFYV